MSEADDLVAKVHMGIDELLEQKVTLLEALEIARAYVEASTYFEKTQEAAIADLAKIDAALKKAGANG